MSLWLHELAEADHRILNPFSERKLRQLGVVSRAAPGTRVLDLACGKGEMLCRWAQQHGVVGHGVDLSAEFLTAAAARAAELGVVDRVSFEQGDAAAFQAPEPCHVVSCLGATWIGDGVGGTIELMRRAVTPDGLLLVGEPYWIDPPTEEVCQALEFGPDDFASLDGTLRRFEAAGCDLVEMVLADGDDWDRYVASQWWNLTEWLRAHSDDRRRDEVRQFRDRQRRSYLTYGRRHLGWGVFVLRPAA